MHNKRQANKAPNLVNEIDFESLEKGILNGQFTSPEEFESTARQVFSVLIKKYETNAWIQKMLNNFLKSLCIIEEQKVPESEPPSVPPSRSQFENKSAPVQDLKSVHPASITSQSSCVNVPGQQSVMSSMNSIIGGGSDGCLPLTKEEKKILGVNIRKLSQKYLRGIIKIVSTERIEGNTLEFDINKLSNKTNRELQKYVSECFVNMEREKNEIATNVIRKSPSTGSTNVNYR